jgi:hypothetical protein
VQTQYPQQDVQPEPVEMTPLEGRGAFKIASPTKQLVIQPDTASTFRVLAERLRAGDPDPFEAGEGIRIRVNANPDGDDGSRWLAAHDDYGLGVGFLLEPADVEQIADALEYYAGITAA